MRTVRVCLLIVASVVVLLAKDNAQEMPQVKRRVDPKYPAILKQAGIEGDVYVKVTLNEQGMIEKAESAKPSNPDFIPAALEAIKQWEFTPAFDNGKPIRTEVVIPFKFRLGTDSYKSGYEEIFKLKEDALQILRGELTDELKTLINSEAHVVIGEKYEQLDSLLADKQKSLLLIEGKATKIEMSRLRSDPTKRTAYLVLKTKPSAKISNRFHTIVFMQNDNGEWKLETWHVSQ